MEEKDKNEKNKTKMRRQTKIKGLEKLLKVTYSF